jgi:TM2 domain-containing membrane protein YozV
MPCVNHPSSDVQSYCQSCGKPLCTACVRTTPSGQILCESCLAASASGGGPSQAYWQSFGQPFVTPQPGAPNPAAAAVLGLIPGVGAMYNGQLFKGLIHIVIFAVLVSITDNYPIFGLFIAGWVLYQSFEAFHTAKARRDGLPIPDPLGLNELGSWLNLGGHGRGPVANPGPPQNPPPPPSGYDPGPPAGAAGTQPPPYSAPYTSSWDTASGTVPPQPPYTETYPGANPDPNAPYAQNYPPGYIPPIPPVPPIPPIPTYGWRRKEPVWAIVLIVLGVMFLLKSLGFVGHLFHYAWPVLLIGFGVWLIVSRLGYSQGGSK